LNKLDDLRLDLLTGGLSKNKLLRLSEVVNSRRPEIEDPRLNEILDEIDLRAQVELAKFHPRLEESSKGAFPYGHCTFEYKPTEKNLT
jgi:hypothetical protein